MAVTLLFRAYNGLHHRIFDNMSFACLLSYCSFWLLLKEEWEAYFGVLCSNWLLYSNGVLIPYLKIIILFLFLPTVCNFDFNCYVICLTLT